MGKVMSVFNPTASELRQQAARDYEAAMGGMKINDLIPWGDIGFSPANGLDGQWFAGQCHDDRRAIIDAIQDIGMKPVYEKNTPEERHASERAIAPEVRTAKWRYILSLVNEGYELGYDQMDMEVMAPLCARLATVERGADNPHMPTTHKLRHNPAVHSMHVAGLAKDIFDELVLEHEGLPEETELRDIQTRIMRAALVHDMGELKGELSVAITRQGMSAAEEQTFEHNRGLAEEEIFEAALHGRVEKLAKTGWPADELKGRCDKLLNDYSVAESDSFLGRAHKLIERMQTQQDYLRFEGKDMTPPQSTLLGDKYHKDFMEGYAKKPMGGKPFASMRERGGATMEEAPILEKVPSLQELAEEFENPQVAGRIKEALDNQLEGLQKEVVDRLGSRSFAEKFLQGVRTQEAPGMGR